MAVLKMKKLSLIGLLADREAILDAIQRFGHVQVSSMAEHAAAEDPSAGENSSAGTALTRITAGERLERILAALNQAEGAIAYIESVCPQKKGMFQSRPEVSRHQVEEVCGRLDAYLERIAELTDIRQTALELAADTNRLEIQAEQLAPWEGLDIPFSEVRDTAELRLALGTVPLLAVGSFEEAFGSDIPGGFLIPLRGTPAETAYLAGYRRTYQEEAASLFQEYGWNAFSPSSLGWTDTPEQVGKSIRQRIDAHACRQQEIAEKAAASGAILPELRILFDGLSLEREKLQTMERLGGTQKTVVLEGWIPEKGIPDFEKRMTALRTPLYLAFTDPEEGDAVPTLLRNNSLVEPFEMVTEMYTMPVYGEIDPNFLMAPFFVVYFGMMLSDAGYGLLLALGALFVLWKTKLKGVPRKIAQLLVLGGLCTIPWGLLFGGIFGDTFKTVFGLGPLWFDPVEEPLNMIFLSLGMGIFQILVGLGTKVYLNIRQGHIWDAVFDQGFWVLVLLGCLSLAGGSIAPWLPTVGKYAALIGAVGLLVTQGRGKPKVYGKILSGLGSLYGVTGYFSDIVSYVRLFALGLATGIIGNVINLLCRMLSGSVVGFIAAVLLFVGGHLFNLSINALGAFVHSARLQYIEFYGKFYEGGGVLFTAFADKDKIHRHSVKYNRAV